MPAKCVRSDKAWSGRTAGDVAYDVIFEHAA